ncbi:MULTISPECIES: hypothetical protein [unclassified Microbulbifer]|uniref:hypothetical protein n=1 Tax=unclassified Microbulbifer TaxID=2619833 RepID=UPI0027E54D47|nr:MULTISPECIES: hypothetical protein [unclassified Microbulbifer]
MDQDVKEKTVSTSQHDLTESQKKELSALSKATYDSEVKRYQTLISKDQKLASVLCGCYPPPPPPQCCPVDMCGCFCLSSCGSHSCGCGEWDEYVSITCSGGTWGPEGSPPLRFNFNGYVEATIPAPVTIDEELQFFGYIDSSASIYGNNRKIRLLVSRPNIVSIMIYGDYGRPIGTISAHSPYQFSSGFAAMGSANISS